MRLLLVEDDTRLSDRLRIELEQAGFAVDVVADGVDAEFMGESEPYDVVVLDLGLPGRPGLEVLRGWRATGNLMPVLILTARDAWHEKVDGFKAGADDYLGKPFHAAELIARLHALLRRGIARPHGPLRVAGLELDEDTQTARILATGEAFDLTGTEFRLLRYFMLHPGRVLSKTRLAEHVYDFATERDSNVLEVYINRLRRKLGRDLIATRRGQGYVFGGRRRMTSLQARLSAGLIRRAGGTDRSGGRHRRLFAAADRREFRRHPPGTRPGNLAGRAGIRHRRPAPVGRRPDQRHLSPALFGTLLPDREPGGEICSRSLWDAELPLPPLTADRVHPHLSSRVRRISDCCWSVGPSGFGTSLSPCRDRGFHPGGRRTPAPAAGIQPHRPDVVWRAAAAPAADRAAWSGPAGAGAPRTAPAGARGNSPIIRSTRQPRCGHWSPNSTGCST